MYMDKTILSLLEKYQDLPKEERERKINNIIGQLIDQLAAENKTTINAMDLESAKQLSNASLSGVDYSKAFDNEEELERKGGKKYRKMSRRRRRNKKGGRSKKNRKGTY